MTDVVMALRYHFERGDQRDVQLAGKNPINGYQFFHYTHENNPIQRPAEAFKTLDKISVNYQFAVHNEGCLYMRLRSCWCLHCWSELMNGVGTWSTATHRIQGCEATASEAATDTEAPGMYDFIRRECTKTMGPGVAEMIKQDMRCRNKVAAELTVGDWALFSHLTDDGSQQLWLGRVVSNEEWGGKGVRQNNERRMHSYAGGLKVGPKEVALHIMWYEVIGADGESLEYQLSRSDTSPIVQSNKYLIPIKFKMHRIIGRCNQVPKLRTTEREGRKNSVSYQTRFDKWHNREFMARWKMDEVVWRDALSLCSN